MPDRPHPGAATSEGRQALTVADVRRRLNGALRREQLDRLDLAHEDQVDLLAAAAEVLERAEDLAVVGVLRDRLLERLGRIETATHGGGEVWAGLPDPPEGQPAGLLPVLALLVTAPDVRAFHASRAVPAAVSWASMGDLGHQVRVHRLLRGRFGLGTAWWLSLVWSGAFYRLGRLQLNLQPAPDDPGSWVLDTHIPRGGSLEPAQVDASFAAARAFFATHFPERPVRDVVCHSWLLDPALGELLPGSNLASFQTRWVPYGEPAPGDGDVLSFVFLRDAATPPAPLPTDTRLRRVVANRLAAGEHWSVVSGRLAVLP